MKRRLALLLALSLTLASVPVTGAAAAENTAAGTEVVTETVQEEAEADAAEETTVADPTVEGEGETVVEVTAAGTENQEVTTENNEDASEAATTEVSGEGNTTDAVSTEVAAVVEPGTGEGLVVTDPVVEVETLAKGTWTKKQGVWYYAKEDGTNQTGWAEIDGVIYYFDQEGKMQTGWVEIDGNWYFMDRNNGDLKTGWLLDGRTWYYMEETGVMHTGWLDLGPNKFFFKDSGAMQKGWWQEGENWHFADNNGFVKKGWALDGQTWYYFDESYNMLTGWLNLGPNKFFFKDSGAMQKGWWQEGENWHFADNNGFVKKGWVLDGKTWYLFDDDYNMYTDWYSDGNNWFYLSVTTGAMAAQPTKITGAVWFFYPNGTLANTEGWKVSGAYMYYTYHDGHCAVNTTIDGIKLDEWGRTSMTPMDLKAQNYTSRTDYLILVNKADFTVNVYYWQSGMWTRIKSWDCTHGGSLTPVGQWELEARVTKRDAYWGWAEFDYSSAAFAISISAGNFFHSILFDKLYEGNNYGSQYGGLNPYNRTIRDGNMRRDYSNSCIRLELPNAEWLYRNVPMGTKVVIY